MPENKQTVLAREIVAYFDFDGTLTTRDTLIPFIIYAVGLVKFILKLPVIIPIVVLYWLKIIDNETAKQRFLIQMISGVTQEKIDIAAHDFAYHKLDKYIKPEIYSKLEYHLEHKHSVILVSANLAIYLRKWALRHNLSGVVATELEVIRGKYTGRLATHNCYGMRKIERIVQYIKQQQFSFVYSYAYGNSRGDYELLDYVNEAYWVNGADIKPWTEYNKTT